jgi:hypothetical protein
MNLMGKKTFLLVVLVANRVPGTAVGQRYIYVPDSEPLDAQPSPLEGGLTKLI